MAFCLPASDPLECIFKATAGDLVRRSNTLRRSIKAWGDQSHPTYGINNQPMHQQRESYRIKYSTPRYATVRYGTTQLLPRHASSHGPQSARERGLRGTHNKSRMENRHDGSIHKKTSTESVSDHETNNEDTKETLTKVWRKKSKKHSMVRARTGRKAESCKSPCLSPGMTFARTSRSTGIFFKNGMRPLASRNKGTNGLISAAPR